MVEDIMFAPVIFAVTPPPGWLIAMLGVYALVLIPLIFWGLGRTGKRNLAWIFVPIVAIAASALLWLYVNRQVLG